MAATNTHFAKVHVAVGVSHRTDTMNLATTHLSLVNLPKKQHSVNDITIRPSVVQIVKIVTPGRIAVAKEPLYTIATYIPE